ncbi:MAG: right-handed parallel beta-helix repeat-containing protein, partial [Chitinophagales bacterium]
MFIFWFLGILFLGVSSPAIAITYHVNESTLCTTDCDGTTWAKAFDELQDALDVASVNDEVWVAEGIYYSSKDSFGNASPTDNRDKVFYLNKDLKIYGGFPNTGNPTMTDRNWESKVTKLSGDFNQDDVLISDKEDANFPAQNNEENAYTVVRTANLSANSILDGFFIESGNATNDGGGMYNFYSDLTLMNCHFANNTAASYGGGIYNYNSDPTVTYCSSANNKAGERGGGISNFRSNSTVTYCSFYNNTASIRGGGMYNSAFSDPIVTNCNFDNNSAGSGGGMSNTVGDPTITNCIFTNNSAGSGGGMDNSSSDPIITNCSFDNNSVTGSGGGMNNSDSDPIVMNCIFINNEANNYGGGMENGYSDSTVSNCSFDNNTARLGGGMFNAGGVPTVSNCSFANNTANNDGGGMYNNVGNPIVMNCSFTNNSANENGGGMYHRTGAPTVTNCSFANNSANENGGGMYIFVSDPTVTNCILWNNGSEIFSFSSYSSPIFSHCIVEGGYSMGTNILNQDPLFIDSDNNDFRLYRHSPAIDAGDNTADLDGSGSGKTTIEDIPTDLGGNARIFNCTIDLGSYETLTITGSLSYCSSEGYTLLDAGFCASYHWSNNATSQTIQASQGIYTVTITNNNGYTAIMEASVTANAKPTPQITGNLEDCPSNNSNTLDAGTWESYQWSSSENSQIIIASVGTYTVTVTDTNGCKGTSVVEVSTIPCLAEAGTLTSNEDEICAGGDLEVSTVGLPNSTNYLQYFFIYTQDNLGNTILHESTIVNVEVGESSANFSGLTVGDYLLCSYNEGQDCLPNPSPIRTDLDDIYDTGSIQHGCYDIECRTITISEVSDSNLESSITVLQTETGTNLFNAEVCGGTAPYSEDFTSSGGFASVQEYPSENVGCINYQITYGNAVDWTLTITDSNGCNNESVVFTNDGIDSNPIPQITETTVNPEKCVGDEDGSISIEVEGGDDDCGEYTYAWSSTNGFSATMIGGITGNTVNNLASGIYDVTVTDCAGTSVTDNIYVSRTNGGSGRGRGRSRGRGGCKTAGNNFNDLTSLKAFPNPFGQITSIEFSIASTSKV